MVVEEKATQGVDVIGIGCHLIDGTMERREQKNGIQAGALAGG